MFNRTSLRCALEVPRRHCEPRMPVGLACWVLGARKTCEPYQLGELRPDPFGQRVGVFLALPSGRSPHAAALDYIGGTSGSCRRGGLRNQDLEHAPGDVYHALIFADADAELDGFARSGSAVAECTQEIAAAWARYAEEVMRHTSEASQA